MIIINPGSFNPNDISVVEYIKDAKRKIEDFGLEDKIKNEGGLLTLESELLNGQTIVGIIPSGFSEELKLEIAMALAR